MSYQAVDAVLRAAIKPPALKLVAVVMANALNHKTRQLNIGHQAIADAVGIDKRNAQRYVKELRELGVVSVIANANGGPPGSTPFYRLHLDRLAELTVGTDSQRSTDGASATPTDGDSAAPQAREDGETDGAGIQEGRHTHPGRTAQASQTDGPGAVLTWLNQKEPEGNRVCAQASLAGIETLPADAGATGADPGEGVEKRSGKKVKAGAGKEEAKTDAAWKAYSDAYAERYGVAPVRNAKVNGILAKLLERIPAAEAPAVAAFYVHHPRPFYATKMHAVDFLLSDVESLRTQWKTGRVVEDWSMRGRALNKQSALEERNRRVAEAWARGENDKDRRSVSGAATSARSARVASFDDFDYSEGLPGRG